jgi:hypothetical protein
MTDNELKIALAIHEGAMKLVAADMPVPSAVKYSKEAMKLSLKEAVAGFEGVGSAQPPSSNAHPHHPRNWSSTLGGEKFEEKYEGPNKTITLRPYRIPSWTRRELFDLMGIRVDPCLLQGEINYKWYNMMLDVEGVRRVLADNRFYLMTK